MSINTTLRCTAFEELMFAQDSPPYPCVIVGRTQVRGTIVRKWFEEAIEQMIRRHPLFRARRRMRWGRSAWEIQTEPKYRIEWIAKRADSTWADDSYVDLRKDIGLHVTIEEQREDSFLVFRVHHAIVDGLGYFNALHDMWAIYDSLATSAPLNLPEIKEDELPNRNHFGMTWRKLLETIPRQMVGLAGIRQFIMRRPVPLVAHSLFWGPSAVPLPVEVVNHRFDQSVSKAIVDAAKRLKVSHNDLIASCIFRACEAFRASSSKQTDSDWLRMMVPVSMRTTKTDYQQTACNIVSSVFLDRTPVQIRDRDYLLDSIHKEMELIKTNRLALMFILSIWLQKITLFRDISAQPPSKCPASLVFTNLGKVYRRSSLCDGQQRVVAGGLIIEDVDAVAPLTPYMSAAFSALQYAMRLSLSLRYDPRVIQRQQAEDLLAKVVADLTCHTTSDDSAENAKPSLNNVEAGAI